MYDETKHRCGVRYLLHLRHKKGLSWFREYISKYSFSSEVLNDVFDQWKKGNKGEWNYWL